LDALVKEMKALKQRAKLAYFYHYWMEEFDNVKMEDAFIKAELLIYQKRSKGSLAE